MKIRSLLMATSFVALTAGTAHADLALRMTNTDGIMNNAQEKPILLANETKDDLSANGVYFEFEIYDDEGSEIPATDAIDVEFTFPAGVTLGSDTSGTDVVDGTDGVVTGASPRQDIAGTGNFGDQKARYTVSISNDPSDTIKTIGFHLDLDVSYALCQAKDTEKYNVEVTAYLDTDDGDEPTDGTPLFGGFAETFMLMCTDGVVGMVQSDEDVTDTAIALPDYHGFDFNIDDDDPYDESVYYYGAPWGRLGGVNYMLNDDAVTYIAGNTEDNHLLDNSDVAAIKFDVKFGKNLVGIGNTFVGRLDAGEPTDDATGDPHVDMAIHHELTGRDKNRLLNRDRKTGIWVYSDWSDAIKEQSTEITNSWVTFQNSNLISEEGGEDICGDGELDFLQRQGRKFGFFDWVGSDDGTMNVFRVTGLPKDAVHPLDYDMVFENSSSEWAYNTTIRRSIAPADMPHGEFVITTMDIMEAFADEGLDPNFGRIDVKFKFLSESPDIDVDRLQATADGNLNDYGGGANFNAWYNEHNPQNDGDQQLGSE